MTDFLSAIANSFHKSPERTSVQGLSGSFQLMSEQQLIS